MIRNDFCFPVLVTVNEKTVSVPQNATHALEGTGWSKWDWMPGNLSEIAKKKVIYPLKGKEKVDVGPGGGVHVGSDEFGYDFSTPEGTEVYPMLGGVVIRVIGHYELAHQDLTRKKDVNTIEILHLDGTVARYSHLKKDSIRVKHCDVVGAEQVIGLSGNTGYSTGPHLHVDVFKATSGNTYQTIPLEFSKREPATSVSF